MSILIRRLIFHMCIAIGLPVVILAGVFLSSLVVLYPISAIMGWI